MELDLSYDKKTVGEHQFLDGKELSYPYAYTYNCPYVTSVWDSGVIEVKAGGAVRTMDFMKITDTTVRTAG